MRVLWKPTSCSVRTLINTARIDNHQLEHIVTHAYRVLSITLFAVVSAVLVACADQPLNTPAVTEPIAVTPVTTTVTCDSGWVEDGRGGATCNGPVDLCADDWYANYGTCAGYDPTTDPCFPFGCSGGGGGGGGGGGSTACNDERDVLIYEYQTQSGLAAPACGAFTQSASNQFYSFSQLNVNNTHGWAIIRPPLQINASQSYGLARWVAEIDGVPRTLNSVYRCPHRNAAVQGAPSSRHMAGDAVDMDVTTNSLSEWQVYANAAVRAKASYVEPTTLPCGTGCTHADWRGY